jgi:YidC/Oxa1 family membrane protein insertase
MGDPTQAMILKTMPFILIFVFASFPSGIVLYWIVNNILSIMQQLYVEKIIIPKAVITFQKRLKEGK